MIIYSQQKLVLIKTLFIVKGFVVFLSKGKNKDVSFEKRKEKKKKKTYAEKGVTRADKDKIADVIKV